MYIYRHIIYISYGEYPITMVICGYSGESSHYMGKMGMFLGNTMGIAWVFGESSWTYPLANIQKTIENHHFE